MKKKKVVINISLKKPLNKHTFATQSSLSPSRNLAGSGRKLVSTNRFSPHAKKELNASAAANANFTSALEEL